MNVDNVIMLLQIENLGPPLIYELETHSSSINTSINNEIILIKQFDWRKLRLWSSPCKAWVCFQHLVVGKLGDKP